eukprot:3267568-Pleurochrysis_carterae.AAC.1
MLLGYLVAGTIAGPHCLELIQEVIQTEALAQLGLALLLFVLGAELDFGRRATRETHACARTRTRTHMGARAHARACTHAHACTRK